MKNISRNFSIFIEKDSAFGPQISKSIKLLIKRPLKMSMQKIAPPPKSRLSNILSDIGGNAGWTAGILGGGALLYPFFTEREF